MRTRLLALVTLLAIAAPLALGCRSKKAPEGAEPPQAQPPAELPPPPTSSPAEVPPQPAPEPLPGEPKAEADPLPAAGRWGHVTAEAHVVERELGPSCKVRRIEPRFSGLTGETSSERLNAALSAEFDAVEKALFSDRPCQGATAELPFGFEASYELGATRGRHVALELSASSYMGGAHPNGLVRCLVVSLDSGELLQLGALLTPHGRAKLSSLATERLAREHGVTRLSDAGFFVDKVQVQDPYGVCLTEGGISVQFQPYEVAPHALGVPTVEFSLDEVREMFDRARTQALLAD